MAKTFGILSSQESPLMFISFQFYTFYIAFFAHCDSLHSIVCMLNEFIFIIITFSLNEICLFHYDKVNRKCFIITKIE